MAEDRLQHDKAFAAEAEPSAQGSQRADPVPNGYHNAVASSTEQNKRQRAQSAEQSGQQDAVASRAGQNGQPDDSPVGTPGQNGQQSQPSKTPLKSPLHHEEAWEDTDDEMNVSTGQEEHTGQIIENGQSEVDWIGQIVASAGPEPAVATRAPAESGHLTKVALSSVFSEICQAVLNCARVQVTLNMFTAPCIKPAQGERLGATI